MMCQIMKRFKKKKKIECFNALSVDIYESMTNSFNQIVALWGIYDTFTCTCVYRVFLICKKYCQLFINCDLQSFPYVLNVSVSLSSSIN